MDHIEELSDRVLTLFEQPSLDPDVAASVQRYLADVGIDRHNVLREDAYENFALSYLKREVARFRDDRDHPEIEGDREELLCYCSDADCPLKRGALPKTIRAAPDIDAGILAFKYEHGAYSPVLEEIADAWAERCQRVENALTGAVVALNQGTEVEELPDELVPRIADDPEEARRVAT